MSSQCTWEQITTESRRKTFSDILSLIFRTSYSLRSCLVLLLLNSFYVLCRKGTKVPYMNNTIMSRKRFNESLSDLGDQLPCDNIPNCRYCHLNALVGCAFRYLFKSLSYLNWHILYPLYAGGGGQICPQTFPSFPDSWRERLAQKWADIKVRACKNI